MLGISQPLRTLKTDTNGIVNVLTPPGVIPTNWISAPKTYDKLMQFNAELVEKRIKKALHKLQMTKNLIVINAFNPFFGNHLARTFNEKLLLYYCYDEISAAAWAKNHGKRLEELFIPKTDGVITTSTGLYNDKKQLHPHTFLVKNGVDFEAFNKGLQKSETFIDKKSFKKIVGYIGGIDFRMDLDLMKFAITSLPEYLFVFIGKVTKPEIQEQLSTFQNVEFLGPKSLKELPFYTADFDIGIIPFERNEFTQKIYPLKINEYFALGKPVVMTNFGDMSDFKNIASIVHSKTEFIEALKNELESDNEQKKQNRINIAKQNSWQNRAELLSEIIEKLL
jgi:glycosyltransferase involved in cell wall biosynthesis